MCTFIEEDSKFCWKFHGNAGIIKWYTQKIEGIPWNSGEKNNINYFQVYALKFRRVVNYSEDLVW